MLIVGIAFVLLQVAWPLAAQRPATRSFDVVEATIPELQAAMQSGAVTAVELVDAYLARIAAFDHHGPELNAMIVLNPNARTEAAALDRERTERGVRGPLHGIPVILKDNFDTSDLPTTGGSVALAGLVPPDDGFQVKRLRDAGAIILGKANMHELASGITTVSSLGGQTRNPYDLSRNPGGSSGGTGVAIAASFAAVGWGTDTCGSIRIPASQNNLFGLRPTKGLSSIDGIIPLCHTQDVAGPLARTVTDLAIALDATVGRDHSDPATSALDSIPMPQFFSSLDTNALRGARLGVVTTMFGSEGESGDMTAVVRAGLDQMRLLGAEIVEVEIPGLDTALDGSSVIDFEFKFDLMDYLATTPGAGVSSLEDILDRGLYHRALEERFRRRNRVALRDSPEYRSALSKRGVVRQIVLTAMDRLHVDALVYPTMRVRPAVIGEPQGGSNCQLSATAGLPALSVPAGFTGDGLPVGLELLGRRFDDARLVAFGYAFEHRVHPRRVPSSTPPLSDGGAPGRIAFSVSIGNPADATSLRALAEFRYDPIRGQLDYDVHLLGVQPADVFAVTLGQSDGPLLYRLSGPGVTAMAGTLSLSHEARQDLEGGDLVLAIFARNVPDGRVAHRVQLPMARKSGM